ncbi:MAG: NAD(P)H-binding protein, partial [Halanaerobium sp.]|nr:NAD(P)H-binding protein [Halanaerobium sp.]
MFLVTGATGHIGNVLVKILLAEGYSLRVLVLPDDDLTALDGLPLEVVGGDVRDYPSVCRAVRGVARVFHLAGLVSIGSGKGRLLNQVNVGGTRNVIEACKAHGVKRLVYVS